MKNRWMIVEFSESNSPEMDINCSGQRQIVKVQLSSEHNALKHPAVTTKAREAKIEATEEPILSNFDRHRDQKRNDRCLSDSRSHSYETIIPLARLKSSVHVISM